MCSGALWTGSAAASPLSGTLPGPESQYDVQLATLIADASKYSGNILNGFDGAVDNIFTDVAKLAQIAALTSNSDSNWNIANFSRSDGLSAAITTGEARALWLDVLPDLYGIRVELGADSSNPATFGSYNTSGQFISCQSVYATRASYPTDPVPAASQTSFHSIGVGVTSKYDTVFLALGPKPNQPSLDYDLRDYPASSDLTTLLTGNHSLKIGGNQQAGLNFSPMILYTSSIFNFHAPLYYNPREPCDAPL